MEQEVGIREILRRCNSTVTATDERFMRRCLQLARGGRRNAKPKPMVGAVLVSGERIIGEGYHVRCGEGHAEVNCFASVRPADEPLLTSATLYVSLEPCSHYGRTPPCADLIIRKGVPRVVVGCIDPFAKVSGRGIRKLLDAGIRVTVGVLGKECEELNRRFITFNTLRRPYILLKWAQSADGYIGNREQRVSLSTPFTFMLSHKLRTEYDAILIGRNTLTTDAPQLNVRHWSGPAPERIVLSHSDAGVPDGFFRASGIGDALSHLWEEGRQSLIVEGGAVTLNAFLQAGLWDELRVETTPLLLGTGIAAPRLPDGIRQESREDFDGNIIATYLHD